MQKWIRALCASLALSLLLSAAAGCGRKAAQPGEISKPMLPTVEDTDPGPDPLAAAPADILPGRYVQADDPDVVFDVYAVGGALLFEENGWEDGERAYWFAQEFWPEDREELFSPGGEAILGSCRDYSDIDEANAYMGDANEIELVLLDDGFTFTYAESGATYRYTAGEGPVAHASGAEQAAALAAAHPDAAADPALSGTWANEGEVCSLLLTLGADGTAVYACKIQDMPLRVLVGGWAADAAAGTLYLRGELLGCAAVSAEYELSFTDRDGTLFITEPEDTALLPFYGETPFVRADGSWTFPERLRESFEANPDWDLDYDYGWQENYVIDQLAEPVTYTDPMGGERNCFYYVPRMLMGTPDAETVNAEIEERFLALAQEQIAEIEKGYDPAYPYITWYAERWEDTISVIVCAQTDWESADYAVYCFSADTGARLTNAEILDRLNITEEGFLTVTREEARKCFEGLFSEVPEEDRAAYGYYERLDWTLSEENIDLDMLIYPDSAGDLTVIAPIGSLAGADWYYHYLYPFLGAVG